MSRFRRRHGASASIGINMTPAIDLTFNLLLFFMLTSHFASAEKVEMSLPRPDGSRAVDRRILDKVIVNVMYRGEELEPTLRCGPVEVGSLTELQGRLQEMARWNPGLEVILRADRRTPYGQVRRVMETIAAVKLTKLQVVVELGDYGRGQR